MENEKNGFNKNPVELYNSLSVVQISEIEKLANRAGLPADIADLIEIAIEFAPESKSSISNLLSEMILRPANLDEFKQRAEKLIGLIG